MHKDLKPVTGHTYTGAQIRLMTFEEPPSMMVDLWVPISESDLIISGQATRECYVGVIQDACCPRHIADIPGFENLHFMCLGKTADSEIIHMGNRNNHDRFAQFKAEPSEALLKLCNVYLISENGPESALLWITPKAYPHPIPGTYRIIRRL